MTVEEWKKKNPPIRRKPQTNADRIRAMSDEELAVWFCTGRECDQQHCCFCKMDGCHIDDWLKAPVEVDK